MNEAVTITPFYYFLMEFVKLVLVAFPLIVVIAGLSLIIGSIRPEPWGGSIDGLGVVAGFGVIIVGIFIAVIR